MALENLTARPSGETANSTPAAIARIRQDRELVSTVTASAERAHLPQWGEIVHAPRQKSYAAWRRQI
jgi:hypothetical protein